MSWLEDLLMRGGAVPQEIAHALQSKRGEIPMPPNDVPYPTAADVPAQTNDPISREPQPFLNGTPLPRSRPDSAPRPSMLMSLAPPEQDPATLPTNATPTIGGPSPSAAPVNNSPPGMLGGASGILGKIFDPANAPLLLAMGGGFSGAHSLGEGMQRGFSAAAPQAAALRQEQLKLEPQTATYKALVAKGIPDDIARAASTNKDLLAQILPQAFGSKQRKFTQISENFDGSKNYGFVDEAAGKVYDLAGHELGSGNASPQTNSTLLAKGITQYDPQLQGEPYLAQFSPEMQAAIKARLRGDTQPTGNPRLKGFDTKANEYARTYADQVGIPYSDAIYSERRKFRTELGSTAPSAAGGQAKAFNQGMEHADDLATKLEKLGNWDPIGVPLVASASNYIRQETNSKLKGLAESAAAIGQTLAGEVGKLFSGSAGGGVHERQLTRERFNTIKSPDQLAGALEATLETMDGGLHALEQRRDSVFGPKGPNNPHNDIEFVKKETEDRIAHIREIIGRLRSGQAAPTQPPATPAIQVGAPTQATSPQIPTGAIDMLKKDPSLAAQFDAKYGPNASRAVLGQ